MVNWMVRSAYIYATTFSQVYNSLSEEQKTQLITLADDLGYIDPSGAFLIPSLLRCPRS